MENNELKDLEYIKKLSARYLNILKPNAEKGCKAEIKILNYSELGCLITNTLKLCIMGLENQDKKIDIGLVLEQILHLFPTDEMELLDIINESLVKKGS